MKIVLNTMVRNEERHVQSAMAHFSTLFDEINIVDHLSTDATMDKTLEWRSQDTKINAFRYENEGYYQSELMTVLARRQVATCDADWVFFLDFDEYLPFASRAEFEQALVQYANRPAIFMLWHNLIPLKYGRSLHLGQDYLVGPDASVYGKVAFQPRLMRQHPDLIIEQGNHAITLQPGGDHVFAEHAFGLFHIPIDSADQLQKKIATGLEAYNKHAAARETDLGKHWVLMNDILAAGSDETEVLNAFIARYGENEHLSAMVKKNLAQTHAQLEEKGYRRIKLSSAGVGQGLPDPDKITEALEPERTLALTEDGTVAVDPPFDPIVLPETFNSKDTFKIPALPDHNSFLDGARVPKTLDAFTAASLDQIETLTATAWGGHIPFMFALIKTLRPRRYVELGTHCGASFFAACQTFKQLNLPAMGVAIDLWEGDPQAGFYGKEVYNAFEYLRKTRYPDHGRSIKSYFSEAAPHFEEKSVDLIHIDGLHTYEAVKEDYDTWRPKLTDNGVMIFHDTNEYQATFGVWDFFAKIRGEATESFEFKHTHGLGVLAFGDPKKNPMIQILSCMNAEPVKTERFFARQGELAEKEALLILKSNAPSQKQQPETVATSPDAVGLTTKTLAKILARRVKAKAYSVARQRIGRLAGRH